MFIYFNHLSKKTPFDQYITHLRLTNGFSNHTSIPLHVVVQACVHLANFYHAWSFGNVALYKQRIREKNYY